MVRYEWYPPPFPDLPGVMPCCRTMGIRCPPIGNKNSVPYLTATVGIFPYLRCFSGAFPMRICGKLITLFLFVFVLAATEGCSRKNPDPVIGSLSGTVKVKGEPVTGGQLIFKGTGKDGKEAVNQTITINPD